MTKTKLDKLREVHHDLLTELPEGEAISLLGLQISSHEDLALLGEVYRSSRYETFHYVFTRNTKVVGLTAICCRKINGTAIFTGENKDEFLEELLMRSSKVKADCVYFLHNHPSGNPTPSMIDCKTTKKLVKTILENSPLHFGGHVVINSTQYSVIQADGTYNTLPIKYQSYNIEQMRQTHSFFGTKVRSPEDFASCAKLLQNSEDSFLAIGLSTKYECNCLFEVGYEIFNTSKQRLQVTARNWTAASGVHKVALVNFSIQKLSGDKRTILQNMEKSGLILDIITVDGLSLRSSHQFIPKEDYDGQRKAYEVNEFLVDYLQPELDSELIQAYQRASNALDRVRGQSLQLNTESIINEILQEKESLSQAMHGLCNENKKIWNHSKSEWADEDFLPALQLVDPIKPSYIEHLIKKYNIKILNDQESERTTPQIKI